MNCSREFVRQVLARRKVYSDAQRKRRRRERRWKLATALILEAGL